MKKIVSIFICTSLTFMGVSNFNRKYDVTAHASEINEGNDAVSSELNSSDRPSHVTRYLLQQTDYLDYPAEFSSTMFPGLDSMQRQQIPMEYPTDLLQQNQIGTMFSDLDPMQWQPYHPSFYDIQSYFPEQPFFYTDSSLNLISQQSGLLAEDQVMLRPNETIEESNKSQGRTSSEPDLNERNCSAGSEANCVSNIDENQESQKERDVTQEEKEMARAQAYNVAHREKRNAYNRAYNAAHREEQRAYHRAYYAAHREEQRAYKRAYRAAHKEEHNAYCRAYNARHKDEIAVKQKQLRAERKAAAQGFNG